MSRKKLEGYEFIEKMRETNFTCRYCGEYASSRDHIIPLSDGGEDTIDNIEAICSKCNSKKGSKFWFHNQVADLLGIL